MATRPPIGIPKLSRRSRILLIIAAALIVLLVVGSRLLDTYVDWLWFGEVGFRSVFTTVLVTKLILFFVIGLFVGGSLAASLFVAYRSRPVFVPVTSTDDPLARYRSTVVARIRLFGIGIPLIVGLIAASAGQSDWQQVQLLLHGTSFGVTDPQFHIDIGFYAFTLPFINMVISWLFVAITVSFFGAVVTQYLFGGIRLTGRAGQLSAPARMQLSIIAGVWVLVYAVSYFFDRYDLLFADHSNLVNGFTGATYTDLNAVLPAKIILGIIAGFCAVAFFAGAFLRNLQLPAIAIALLILSSILIGAAWPAIIQQFSVKPNENEKESIPISHNIDATKQAFGLTDDKVAVTPYSGTSEATSAEIRSNAANTATISNIRLLDPSLLASTFTLKEGGPNYYGFPDKLDIDRYTVNGKTEDYIVAARELKSSSLTGQQNNWVNKHMQFTHGNGFVAAPANTVNSAVRDTGDTGGGYPVFQLSDLTTKGQFDLQNPRIYFGELATDDYVITAGRSDGKSIEDDTGTGSFSYNGSGGVSVTNWFKRLVFAAHFTERNILFSSQITGDSKILYNRDPRTRVSKVAPWLTLDGDPYPAVVKGKIVWIVDGYTTLENYPYSQHTPLGAVTNDSLAGVAKQDNRTISYIRNSVKATVDAYDGTVTLFSIDDKDPVLKAWEGVFPGTVRPSSEISSELRAHFRYPEDLFKVQRDLLSRYHVSDPREFFTQKAFWNVPADPAEESADAGSAEKQPPYYVLAQAPGQERPTFQITSALTFLQRQNLSSWVSVSSDGADYGKIKILELPNNEATQIDGPGLAQNRFLTTQGFTSVRTLLQNSGVTVKYGNLLALPISGGMLYVEPIYSQRKESGSPVQLAQVLVAFGNRVGFAPTVEEALNQVFGQGTGDVATKPGSNGSTSTSPTTPTTTTPPTSTSAPPASGDLEQAVRDIEAALNHLRTAQQSGDFGEQGKALAELDAATKRFEAAKLKATTSSQPSSPGPAPTPTPTTGSGG